MSEIVDQGFYVQSAFFPIRQKLELYFWTSWVFGDDDAGFGDSREYTVGANFYPFNTRNARVNAQIIDVDKSAVSSVFGFYVGGQTGATYSGRRFRCSTKCLEGTDDEDSRARRTPIAGAHRICRPTHRSS